ncbi:MAG: hypothetical protein ACYDAK_13715 [Candidatus Limnocylindrales bacterium]
MGLLLGLLVGVVGLILYEQAQAKPVVTGSAAPAAAAAPPQSNPIAAAAPAVSAPSSITAATAALLQFDSTANSSIIDLSQQPAFNGTGYTCKNGSIPYYDPRTQAVYCVIPGALPQSSMGDNIITDSVGSSLSSTLWDSIL